MLRQDASAGKRLAIARFHHADVAFGNGDEFLALDLVLPRPVKKVDSRGQRVGLDASLALQGDDRAIGQRLVRSPEHKLLVHDADVVLGYDDHPKEETQNQLEPDDGQNGWDDPPVTENRADSVRVHAASFFIVKSNAFTEMVKA